MHSLFTQIVHLLTQKQKEIFFTKDQKRQSEKLGILRFKTAGFATVSSLLLRGKLNDADKIIENG